MTTRTQRRIAYALAWLLLRAVQAMSEAWIIPETEPVPTMRQVVIIADHKGDPNQASSERLSGVL